MADKSELLKVPVFADLPDDQLDWFLSQSTEMRLKAGESYSRQGDPADAMFVMLEGQFEGRGELNGETVVFSLEPGDVTGVLPFSRMKQFTVGGRAVTDSRALRFPASLFPDLVQKMPELTKRLVGLMSDRIREATRMEQQKDRLAALGKLSAGLAHELNNPASAAKRATSQLRDMLKRIKRRQPRPRPARAQPGTESRRWKSWRRRWCSRTSLLRTRSRPAIWKISLIPCCAVTDKTICGSWRLIWRARILSLRYWNNCLPSLDAGTARAALVRISASVEIADLLNQIESSTSRISDLVGAIKEYTFMDQAPLQNVDIVKTLETTLTILNHKLKRGVTVVRDYQKIPLLVNSFGSELNQVWTNLIDNAIDAMGGKGELRVRAYRDADCVVVEIGDNGPGISAAVEPHIFEPFFTTKGVGEGTGLGLDTVQRIVRKHRGKIQVESKPGDTRFRCGCRRRRARTNARAVVRRVA